MASGSNQKHRVKYMPPVHIEREANLLLDEWAAKGNEITVPIPLDELVEIHLGLPFEIEDLRSRFGGNDVIGAIWFNDGTICIDASLDPVEYPHLRGRYNFTVAHEVGHWRLHRVQLQEDPNERVLFETDSQPAFVCRDSNRAREEIQADMFAGCLLMPRALLRAQWKDWRGDEAPVQDADLRVRQFEGDRKRDVEIAREAFCKPLAERFEVSAMAMRIRLESVGLFVKEIEPGLFEGGL
ncbi:MAG: ImmA/IrrE family metallo-endopeptidase [Phycisphaerales bacterium]|nr:ImmA/IrrE family metallo-endopeptidase [Phycisphaerales bacterium]